MKAKRLNEMAIEVVVGFFMFGILFALALLTIVLSKDNLFSETYEVKVVFDEVQGLRSGDNVLSRGVQVGRVHDLSILDDGVYVLLHLERPLPLYSNYSVEIQPSSVLGGQYVSLFPGTKNASPIASDSLLAGAPPVSLVAEASEAVAAIKRTLIEEGVLEDLKSTMSQVNKITERLEKGEGTIGKLLAEDNVYNDLQEITSNLRGVTERLNKGEGSLGKLLSEDDTLYEDLREITSNLKEVSTRLADGKGTLGKLLSEDDTLYEDLSKTAASIREVSEGITNGEGTIGKLVTDDEMYQEARLLLQEVRAAVDDLRESAPIVTFSSVFFGAL